MSQQIDLGYDPDVMLLAFVHDLFDVSLRQRNAVAKLGMAFELVVVIHAKEQCVHLARSEFVTNELHKRFQGLLTRRGDTDAANREHFIKLVLCTRQKGAEHQHEREYIPGNFHGGSIWYKLANHPKTGQKISVNGSTPNRTQLPKNGNCS